MGSFLSDVCIPVLTFGGGVIVEHCRQNKKIKDNKINLIDNALKEFIEKTGKKTKIYLLKYDYNRIYNLVNDFCMDYNFDKQFFSEDLVNLSVHSVQNRNLNKLSDCSISIIQRIRSI